jgi:hypothetical protein
MSSKMARACVKILRREEEKIIITSFATLKKIK